MEKNNINLKKDEVTGNFYNYYRPSKFSEMIGQCDIIELAKKEIDKTSNSIIFAGSRGVGKTSLARIVSKTLNCVNVNNYEACENCNNCKMFRDGSYNDYYEKDAASCRGIDEIRKIKENAVFPPILGKYKIFVLDEVHSLTSEAWQALLKILEEPPSYCVFFLLTTNIYKIPDTIISRCRVYNFNNLSEEEIKSFILKILNDRKIQYELPGIDLICSTANGSMRDAVKILEQVSLLGEITEVNVRKCLNFYEEDYSNFIKFLKNKDSEDLLAYCFYLKNKGTDLNIFLDNFIIFLSNLLHFKILKRNSSIFIKNISENINLQEIFNIFNLTNKIRIIFKKTNPNFSAFEIMVLEYANSNQTI